MTHVQDVFSFRETGLPSEGDAFSARGESGYKGLEEGEVECRSDKTALASVVRAVGVDDTLACNDAKELAKRRAKVVRGCLAG
jgi:hypothetical protein